MLFKYKHSLIQSDFNATNFYMDVKHIYLGDKVDLGYFKDMYVEEMIQDMLEQHLKNGVVDLDLIMKKYNKFSYK